MSRKSASQSPLWTGVVCCATFPGLTFPASADVQNYTDDDRPLWFAAVDALGTYDTITFADMPAGTVVTTQYQQDFGVTFSGGVTHFSPSAYPNDSFGFFAVPLTEIRFDTPQNWFAVDHPGLAQFELYSGDELVHTSTPSIFFIGAVSDMPFDRVLLFDPGDNTVAIDDMYFGAIPSPAAGAVFAIWGILRRRERRRTNTE